MKKILLMLALAGGVASAHAQSADTTAVNDLTLKADIYPQQEDGDLYHGLSRKLTFDRMIPPYGLEVTYDKTTHIIFPSAVRYVDQLHRGIRKREKEDSDFKESPPICCSSFSKALSV